MRLVQKEQGSVGDISLCHTLSLSLILCVNFPSSLNLFLFLWLNRGVMTLWQLHKKKKKKKESHFEVEMWGSCQGGQSGGSLCAMSLCVSLRVRWCVRMPVCKCAMHAQTDRWWAEGGKEGWEFKNGVTDGLIARADLNHRRYKKRI